MARKVKFGVTTDRGVHCALCDTRDAAQQVVDARQADDVRARAAGWVSTRSNLPRYSIIKVNGTVF